VPQCRVGYSQVGVFPTGYHNTGETVCLWCVDVRSTAQAADRPIVCWHAIAGSLCSQRGGLRLGCHAGMSRRDPGSRDQLRCTKYEGDAAPGELMVPASHAVII
jgi:hypothetical protein